MNFTQKCDGIYVLNVESSYLNQNFQKFIAIYLKCLIIPDLYFIFDWIDNEMYFRKIFDIQNYNILRKNFHMSSKNIVFKKKYLKLFVFFLHTCQAVLNFFINVIIFLKNGDCVALW